MMHNFPSWPGLICWTVGSRLGCLPKDKDKRFCFVGGHSLFTHGLPVFSTACACLLHLGPRECLVLLVHGVAMGLLECQSRRLGLATCCIMGHNTANTA